MTMPFQSALLIALKEHRLSLSALSGASGLREERLSEIISNADTRVYVEEAVQIARAFGLSLDQFLGAPEVAGHIEIARLYSELPPLLKAQLEAYGQEPPDDQDPPQ